MAPPNSNRWTTDPECIQLINFLIEKTENVKSPLNITQLAREFKENSQSLLSLIGLRDRIRSLRPKIHAMKHIATDTKVRLLFGLSVPVDNDFLEKLKNEAEVIVDDHQRIIKFKEKGGGLKLSGTHVTMPVCNKIIESDKRMMEFLVQKAMEADSPIPLQILAREFKEATGATTTFGYLRQRFMTHRDKIYKSTDFDENTKLRMMFVSSASVPDCFLEILRKDALVEIDKRSRIAKYKANDGSLTLTGDHSPSAKIKAGYAAKRKKNHEARVSTDYDSDIESDNDGVDNSSEEFETDSHNENCQEEDIDPVDLDDNIPVRRRTPSEMSFEDDNDYNPQTRRIHRNEESEKKQKRKSRTYKKRNINPDSDKDEAHNTEEQVTTRSGRASRKRVLDFHYVMDENKDDEALPAKSKKSFSAVSTSSKKKRNSEAIKPASDGSMVPDELDDYNPNHSFHGTDESPMEAQAGIRENEIDEHGIGGLSQRPAVLKSSKKKRKADVEGSNPSKTTKTSSDDYDPNQSTDNSPIIELKPFRGSVLDNAHLIPMDDDIQVLERPPAPAPKDTEMIEIPIKPEDPGTPQKDETPGKKENPVKEEVKPKFTSQLMLLKVIKSLIDTLDTSSLSQMKSKIRQKIWKIGESDKGISNEEMVLAMELLVSRMTNHSVTGLSETAESVNLNQFLCYLKATILNLKLEGLDSLLEKIKGRIKEPTSKEKSIPVEKVESVLQTTLDVIGF